jgi:hypothetical protein
MTKVFLSALAGLAGIAITSPAIAESPPLRDTPPDFHAYVLLDRTGSMNSIWGEALSSVNAYAQELAKPEEGKSVDAMITVAAFDHHAGFQFEPLRRNVRMAGWSDLSETEASPRGSTPLFDAIGEIVTLAEADAPDRAVIVIMTDGLENASEEFNRDSAKSALERAEKRGWEVVFLGADFAKFGDAAAIGLAGSKQMAVSQDRMSLSMGSLARKSKEYARSAAPAPIQFDDADRAEAGEAEVKERKGAN